MKKEKVGKAIQGKAYSTTEVGTMLEDIRKSVKFIAEGHSGLDNRLEKVEVAVHGNSRRLDMLEVSSRIIGNTVSHLEDAVSKLNKDLTATREELKKDILDLGDRLTSVETRR